MSKWPLLKYSEKEIALAIECYLNGLSLDEASEQSGVNAHSIRHHMKAQGISRRSLVEAWSKRKKTPDIEIIKTMYYDKVKSLSQIGKEFGVSAAAIQKKLERAGFPIRKQGHPLVEASKVHRMENHGGWKGGKSINENGYVELRINNRYVLEHRHVWENYYGTIPKGYIIHHINENRTDNRIENLLAMKIGHHVSQHAKQKRVNHNDNHD